MGGTIAYNSNQVTALPPSSLDLLKVNIASSESDSSTVLHLKSIEEDDLHTDVYNEVQDLRVESNQKVVIANIDAELRIAEYPYGQSFVSFVGDLQGDTIREISTTKKLDSGISVKQPAII